MSTQIIEWHNKLTNTLIYTPKLTSSDNNLEIRNLDEGLKFTILAGCYMPNDVYITYIGIYYSVSGSDHQVIYWKDVKNGKYDEQQGFFETRIEEETIHEQAPHEQEPDTIVI